MTPLTPWDHVLAAAVGLVLPVVGVLQHKRGGAEEEPAAMEPRDKLALYWSNSVVLGVLAGITAWVWLGAGRSLGELGLTRAPERMGTGLLLAALFLAVYAVDTLRKLAPGRVAETRERWRTQTPFMPADRREVLHSLSMVTSAAVFEEVVYRGFLVRYVAALTGDDALGLTLAVGLPAVVFALCHLYQGWEGALRVALLSGLFGAALVVTGSLWIPIALHFVVDLVGSLLGPRLLGESTGREAG